MMLVTTLGLAACGGGGATTPATEEPDIPTPTNPTPGTPTPPTPAPTPGVAQTGAQMRNGATGLVGDFTPITYTALGSVPTSGSATYNGYLYGNLANRSDAVTDSVIGQMAMQVGFTSTSVSISGNVTDFVDASDAAMAGSLTLSNGSLNRNGNPAGDATLTVSANGTLTDSANRALAVGVQLEGDFLGGSYGGVGGEALGKVSVNGADQDFDGGFVGAR